MDYPVKRMNLTNKRSGVKVEWQDFEYDITNSGGQKFHVKVHREITYQAPIIKI